MVISSVFTTVVGRPDTWRFTKMAKKNRLKAMESDNYNDDDDLDFSDPESYVDDISDEGKKV